MVSSSFQTKSRVVNPAVICALSLAGASFPEKVLAELPSSAASIEQAMPVEAKPKIAQFAKVSSIQELLNTWKPEVQLYVQGDVGLNDQQLTKIANDIKTHPNWTIYLTESAKGAQYIDAEKNIHTDNQAVEYALGQGLRSLPDFISLKDSKTNLANGNILYISFSKEAEHRKVGYIAGEAYDAKGLGEANWVGSLDRLAIVPLKDGRRIYDAILGTVSTIDAKMLEVSKPFNPKQLFIAFAAVLGLPSVVYLGFRRKVFLDLRKKVNNSIKDIESQLYSYQIASRAISKEFEDLSRFSLVGESKLLLNDLDSKSKAYPAILNDAFAEAAQAKTECKLVGIFSYQKLLELSWKLERDSKNKFQLAINTVNEKFQQMKEGLDTIKGCLDGSLIAKTKLEIQKDFSQLQDLQRDEILGKNFKNDVDQALKTWNADSFEVDKTDPVSSLNALLKIQNLTGGLLKRASELHDQHKKLISDLEKAEEYLEKINIELNCTSFDAEKLEELKAKHAKEVADIETAKAVLRSSSDTWIVNSASYALLFAAVDSSAQSVGLSTGSYAGSSYGGGYSSGGYSSSSGCASSGVGASCSGCASSGF